MSSRILMLNYEFPPLGGGAANANYYFLREFSKNKNIKIDFITSSTSKFVIKIFSKNINIHYINIGKNKKNLQYQSIKDLIYYSCGAYFYAKKLFKKNQYNLIHAWFGIPCGFIAMLLGKPYLVSLRGSDVPFHNPRFEILDKFFFKHLSKIIWRKARVIIANSEGLKKLAQKTAPNQKIEIIYNGINTKEFKPVKNKKSSKVLRIICVARLTKIKGIDYLLKALGTLRNKNIVLTLIGDGKEKENLKELAKDLKIEEKVKFLGSIPHQKIVKYYQESDIFVLPSLNEGMSNTILEAMACKLAIIATNTGGTKELIQGNGFIVPKADTDALRNAIKQFLNNPLLIKSMGEKSRSIAEQMNWSEVAEKYNTIYELA